mmetsp:Transcript_108940/g.216339  ORF Transcript_108940/g.216339 Transcript_108940/m.216339 type:complete len:214 (-) Transcript_108940:749-1390(-)
MVQPLSERQHPFAPVLSDALVIKTAERFRVVILYEEALQDVAEQHQASTIGHEVNEHPLDPVFPGIFDKFLICNECCQHILKTSPHALQFVNHHVAISQDSRKLFLATHVYDLDVLPKFRAFDALADFRRHFLKFASLGCLLRRGHRRGDSSACFTQPADPMMHTTLGSCCGQRHWQHRLRQQKGIKGVHTRSHSVGRRFDSHLIGDKACCTF